MQALSVLETANVLVEAFNAASARDFITAAPPVRDPDGYVLVTVKEDAVTGKKDPITLKFYEDKGTVRVLIPGKQHSALVDPSNYGITSRIISDTCALLKPRAHGPR
jgi:hypothetical protein